MGDIVKVEDCLYFRFSTSTYIVRKSIDGRVVDRSTGEKGTVEKKPNGTWKGKEGLGRAKAKRDKILQKLTGGDLEPIKKKHARFDDYFNKHLIIQKSKAEKTFNASMAPIELRLRPWLNEFCPFIASFTPETWAKYCIFQKENAKNKAGKPIKLAHDRKELCAVLLRAYDDGAIKKRITRASLFLNEGRDKIGRSLEKEERQRLMAALSEAPEYLRLQVCMAIFMGMRRGEILKLKRSMINFKRKEITLESATVKIRRARVIQIHDGLIDLLKKYANECAEKNGVYIFPFGLGSKVVTQDYTRPMTDNKNAWATLKERAGVSCRFHDLKHTYISMAAILGLSTLDVSKQVGTSAKVIEEIYHHTLGETKAKLRSVAIDEFPEEKKEAKK